MDWDDLRFFLAVARTQSLTGAAGELKVSQSTVARRIAALEASLNTSLFFHHQTGYFLTDSGTDVFSYAEDVEEKVLSLSGRVYGSDLRPAGKVRVATAVTLATYLIIPALPLFKSRFPDIQLEIVTSIDTVSVIRNDADIALRLIRPEQQSVKIRRAGCIDSAVYASRHYLDCHPLTGHPVTGRQFITWDAPYSRLPAARWLAQTFPHAPSALVTNSLVTQIAAAKSSLGLAVLPCFIAEREDDLEEVIAKEDVFSEDLWLVSDVNVAASARVRAVMDFLVEIIGERQLG